jgi:hypothetical protein
VDVDGLEAAGDVQLGQLHALVACGVPKGVEICSSL